MGHWLDERIGAVISPATSVMVQKWLSGAGIPSIIWPYNLAQVSLESNGGTSTLAKKYNNYSGIKWSASPYVDGKVKIGKNVYAGYKSPERWANDYARILSLYARPIDATNANDFLQREWRNHYFEDPNYNIKFNQHLKQVMATYGYDPSKGFADIKYQGNSGNPLKPVGPTTAATETVMNSKDPARANDTTKGKAKLPGAPKYDSWFKQHPIWTGVGIAVLGVVVVKSISR